MIEAAGADPRYLPPYSPDFNPVENAFAKLKALLKKTAARTIGGLWDAIGRVLDLFRPSPVDTARYSRPGSAPPLTRMAIPQITPA